jgi:RHS repeat-associated protein
VKREVASLSYDANGNLTSDEVNSYSWNARNQLTSITGSGVTASFQYDPFERRTNKTINGVTTEFLYDGANPVQELSQGSPTANLLSGLRIDEYFARIDSEGTSTLLTDALGSTLALTDDAGTVQTQHTYEPFGTVSASGETNANPFLYTGREDDGTGLYYYRTRYYSPTLQRFVSEDQIGRNRAGNLFAYVGNNPMRYIDPFGLDPMSCREAPPPNEDDLLNYLSGASAILAAAWGTGATAAAAAGFAAIPFGGVVIAVSFGVALGFGVASGALWMWSAAN